METLLKIDTTIGLGGIDSAQFISKLEESEGDISLEISSAGGSMLHGLQMFSALHGRSQTQKVQPKITGLCASMSHMLSLSGSELPEIVDFGVVLIHKPRINNDTEGQNDFQRKMLETMFNSALIGMSQKSGIEMAKLDSLMSANKGEGTWLSAQECFEMGLTKEPTPTETVDKGAKMEALKVAYMESIQDVQMEIVSPKIDIQMENVTMEVHNEVVLKLEAETKQRLAVELKLEAIESQMKAENRTRIEGIVLEAKGKGKITEESVEKWVELGVTDEALMSETLAGISVTMVAPKVDAPQGESNEPAMSFSELEQKHPEKLKEIFTNDPAMYQSLLTDHLTALKSK